MNNKALITLEACILIILVVAGLIAMQGYLKRSIQGNWRTNADSFSDEQFEEGVTPPETVSALQFIAPTMKVDFNLDETIDRPSIDLVSTTGIQQISGWGTYKDRRTHEED